MYFLMSIFIFVNGATEPTQSLRIPTSKFSVTTPTDFRRDDGALISANRQISVGYHEFSIPPKKNGDPFESHAMAEQAKKDKAKTVDTMTLKHQGLTAALVHSVPKNTKDAKQWILLLDLPTGKETALIAVSYTNPKDAETAKRIALSASYNAKWVIDTFDGIDTRFDPSPLLRDNVKHGPNTISFSKKGDFTSLPRVLLMITMKSAEKTLIHKQNYKDIFKTIYGRSRRSVEKIVPAKFGEYDGFTYTGIETPKDKTKGPVLYFVAHLLNNNNHQLIMFEGVAESRADLQFFEKMSQSLAPNTH